MLLLALLLEPLCLGYTKLVMHAAAAETARAVLSDYDGDLSDCRAFTLRRLAAIPEVSLFHVGGADDWQIEAERSDALGKEVSVKIQGHARSLPLLGVSAAAFGQSDDVGIVLTSSVTQSMRPEWLEGSYGTWQNIWS